MPAARLACSLLVATTLAVAVEGQTPRLLRDIDVRPNPPEPASFVEAGGRGWFLAAIAGPATLRAARTPTGVVLAY